jgi:cell division ATPase FtsA
MGESGAESAAYRAAARGGRGGRTSAYGYFVKHYVENKGMKQAEAEKKASGRMVSVGGKSMAKGLARLAKARPKSQYRISSARSAKANAKRNASLSALRRAPKAAATRTAAAWSSFGRTGIHRPTKGGWKAAGLKKASIKKASAKKAGKKK